jgi:hypothetical protein
MISGYSQSDGRQSLQFLNMAVSSRLAGLGGVNVSYADRDVNFFYANPALSGDTLSGMASVNYHFYVGDIGHAAITYSADLPEAGTVTIGVQHVNYGDIAGYDANGAELGDFNSQETALVIGKTHRIGNYRFGGSLKGIFSNYAGFRANGMAIDVGGVFIHPQQQLTVGLVIRNFGFMISDFSETADTKLPFDVQIGTTFKPEHMPLRFSLTAFDLAAQNGTGNNENSEQGFAERVFNHINVGTEILVHRNVDLLVGYNYRKHRELKIENAGGGAGLSVGFSTSIKMVDFVVCRTGYVAGNAAYSFTLSSNINKYLKRR